MLARVLLNKGDQPNVFILNFDNAGKVAPKELESKCVCPNNCYSQFTEDEMYSIQLQMAELGDAKHRMHKIMSTSSIKKKKSYFSKFSFVHELV